MTWWNDTDTNKDVEFTQIEAGTYTAKLSSVKCDETTTPHRISLGWELTSSEFKGRYVWQNFKMDEKSAKWCAWQLGTLGAWQAGRDATSEQEHTDFIFKALEEMQNHMMVELEVENNYYEPTQKTYTNGKIVRVVDAASTNDVPSTDDDEAMPF